MQRSSSDSEFNRVGILGVVAIVLVAGVAAWFLNRDRSDVDPATETPTLSVEPDVPTDSGPRFPVPERLPERDAPDELTPLPSLDDSDSYFRLELGNQFGDGVEALLVDRGLIESFVATIDNLPQPSVAERIRPVGPLADPFSADGQDDSGVYTINPSSFDRYDLLVTMLARADRDTVVDLYRRFYPLFQQAYENLGYPDRYFNDRLVEVIDHLLETPDVDRPVRLVRPHVLYEYEDPELESLSAGQKLMLRIGSEHAVVVKQFLEEIRDRIAVPASPE